MKKRPNQQSQQLQRLKKFLNQKPDPTKNPSSNPNTKKSPFQSPSWLNPLKQRYLKWRRQYWRPQDKHIAMISAFLIFSTYICYRMQKQYYEMKQIVDKTQSFKQLQINKEKKYINRMLKKEEFEPVQITEQYEPKIKYKFEQYETADEEMDTKNELFEVMREDYLQGKTIPEQYEKEFFRLYPDLRSKI